MADTDKLRRKSFWYWLLGLKPKNNPMLEHYVDRRKRRMPSWGRILLICGRFIALGITAIAGAVYLIDFFYHL